ERDDVLEELRVQAVRPEDDRAGAALSFALGMTADVLLRGRREQRERPEAAGACSCATGEHAAEAEAKQTEPGTVDEGLALGPLGDAQGVGELAGDEHLVERAVGLA